MTLSLAITLALILILLLISAFFSGSETALTALSRPHIHQLRRRGSARARLVENLVAMRASLIGAILLGNNLVNILASALATSVFLEFFGATGILYATFVMTAMVVIFAEILPKTYALANAERMALAVAPLLRILVAVLAPVTRAIQALVTATLKLFGAASPDSSLSAHDELRGAIALHHREGKVIKRDRDMLGGVLDLRKLDVADVMVHRTNMKTVDADSDIQTIISAVLESGKTRLPVWRGEPENIIGIIHAKDLLRELNRVDGDMSRLSIEELFTPPWFVPDTTSLPDQLNAFLKRKTHFALVVDEYGEVMGLITLEDILEEIVGEIADEHDTEISGIHRQPEGGVIVDGDVPIRDLNRAMDWNLPEDQATTIAGLVIHEAQTIPDTGQVFTFHGFRIEVTGRERNRLINLRIKPVRTQESGLSP
ncbi:MAG TPA: HlyC/CorC family transporter [Rhodobacteraceae bacterium]|nr:HlyC/CorC family transporter [Paracoccaceae bacterium]